MNINELRPKALAQAKRAQRAAVPPAVDGAALATPTRRDGAKLTMLPYKGYMIVNSHHTGNWWVQQGKAIMAFIEDGSMTKAKLYIDHRIAKGLDKEK